MALPRPILSLTIAPANSADRERLHAALATICAADSSLSVVADPASSVTELRGENLEQMAAVAERIEDEFQISLDFASVSVIRLETVQQSAQGEGRHIRQSGGSGNYGHVQLRLQPNTPGWGIQFAPAIASEIVPPKFYSDIEAGIREAAAAGVLGHEMTDIRVTLNGGSYHEIDSTAVAFRIAASLAFQDAARKAHPVLLEPIMTVTFTVASSSLGAIVREISVRRGRVTSAHQSAETIIVEATIPLAEMLRGTDPLPTSTVFQSFEPIPSNPDDADPAGSAVRNPSGPKPRSSSAAAEPDTDFDWT